MRCGYFICNLILLRTIYGFNLENREPLVKKAPDGQKGSYFGFSVALHQTFETTNGSEDNWLLVGAPLGNNLQPNSNRSGALFKCPVTNDECVQVETDGKRVEDFDYNDDTVSESKLFPPGRDEIKTEQWLGVTVKSQKPGGKVIVCAHRYIQSENISLHHYGQGLCYMLDNKLKVNEVLQYCKGKPTDKLHQQFGFCQIGISASFVGDNFSLVGSPGPYTWRGTIFGQDTESDILEKDNAIYHGPFTDDEQVIEKYSYLGMSVGGGHFFTKNKYTYVTGAPRSHKMLGQVYFFDKIKNNEDLNISLVITGLQFASSFGYELLGCDVNNDGYDDLFVGAPFYYGENKGGAVYIYYTLRNCRVDCQPDQIIYGRAWSRFGFSMTSLGDINKDGYVDVAIGAPYEDEQGAVYIYLGSGNGLIAEPSQIIRARDFKTLGYSLSGGFDMDYNGYPDLLVGAYENDTALLFRTRPIVDIKIKIKSAELRNINATKKGCLADPGNLNNTCFSFKSCFQIVGSIKEQKSITVIYNVTEVKKIVSRIWFKDQRHSDKRKAERMEVITNVKPKKEYCQEEVVYIINDVSDILSAINFKVQYSLENDNFHSPILNKTSVKKFDASFQKNCGSDDICKSYLKLTVGTNLKENITGIYAVDTLNEEFILKARVENQAEDAYEAKLFVVHPNALSYIALKVDKDDPVNVKCSVFNNTLVACDIGNPFRALQYINISLRFEILKSTEQQVLNLSVFVNSTSKEQSKETFKSIKAVLHKNAQFIISGKASTNLFFGGPNIGESAMNHLEDIGTTVTHKYQIDNNGQWDISNLKVSILWPLQVSPGPDAPADMPGKWLLYLVSKPTVLPRTNGYCEVADGKINELQLNSTKPIQEEPEPENLMLPSEFLTKTPREEKLRRKRDLNYIVPPQMKEKGGKKRKITVMDCLSGTAKCVRIFCSISKLVKGNPVVIDIKSRIWNSTLVEDYSKVDWVEIRSHASAEITDSSFSTTPETINQISAETIAYPEILSLDDSLNWWIIGWSVLAGILLLILIAIVLCKCGFFNRKRVSDHTLSGNLQKKDEAEESNLLNN